MNAGPSTSAHAPIAGAGLGLRRGLLTPLESVAPGAIDFMEVAPENWIGVGGRLGRRFRSFTERHPFSAHGLSLFDVARGRVEKDLEQWQPICHWLDS